MLILQKLLTLMVMPLALCCILFTFSFLLLLLGKRILSLTLLSFALCWLYLSSTPWFATTLMAQLEKKFTPPTPTQCDKANRDQNLIIVLGGGLQGITSPDIYPRLLPAGDRVWHAARLYHAGCGNTILVSGGGINIDTIESTEAYGMSQLLQQLGVPADALLLEAQSRTTQENAISSAELLAGAQFTSIYLVTSAWHMPRAQHLFSKQNIHTVAAPADFRSLLSCEQRYRFCWLPHAEAQANTAVALKELLALVVLKVSELL